MSLLAGHDETPTVAGGRGRAAAAGAVVLALLVGGAVYALRSSRTSEPPPSAPAEPASPPPRADAATAILRVTADVQGAVVHLDGERLGTAPQTAEGLAAGSHELRVERSGREPFEFRVELAPGEDRTLHAELRPVAGTAPRPAPALRVGADVPGATVFLDRQFVGETPVEIARLSPGLHRLNVAADGYPTHAEEIEGAGPPREIQVRFQQVRLAQRVAVKHKRTFGSREGTLHADTSGLRFDSAKPDDSFEVGFDQLEEFEVDYLRDNLKVKIRRGRTYNFTSQSGDPDELFVFHREVEKARERLGN